MPSLQPLGISSLCFRTEETVHHEGENKNFSVGRLSNAITVISLLNNMLDYCFSKVQIKILSSHIFT